MIHLRRTDFNDKEFKDLVIMLDKDLQERYGAEQTVFDQFNKTDVHYRIVVAMEDGRPCGCGSFRPIDETCAEVKRMFVINSYRNRGVGALILDELSRWAMEMHFRTLILETGLYQPEAIRLYEKAGFTRIPNFGPYKYIDLSICYGKDL